MSLLKKSMTAATALLGLGLTVSCGSADQSNSDLKIVDGVEIPFDAEPSVAFLYNIKGEAGSICTGTL